MLNGDIQFNEYRPPQYTPNETSKIVQWVIKHSGGQIKDERQATMVLIIFAIVGIIFAVFMFVWGTGPTKHPEIKAPPPETINSGQ